MTDRELLELAAKAAGYKFECYLCDKYPFHKVYYADNKEWNPLLDDSDALRLAVKLGMYINIYSTSMHHTFAGFGKSIAEEAHGNDPYAATRRAIVQAAAEIGKEMK